MAGDVDGLAPGRQYRPWLLLLVIVETEGDGPLMLNASQMLWLTCETTSVLSVEKGVLIPTPASKDGESLACVFVYSDHHGMPSLGLTSAISKPPLTSK